MESPVISLPLARSEGMTLSPRRSDAPVGALVRKTQPVVMMLMAATAASVVRCFGFMTLLRLGLRRGIYRPFRQGAPRSAYSEGERDHSDRHRHDAHIEHRNQVFEIVDVAVQRKLHVT